MSHNQLSDGVAAFIQSGLGIVAAACGERGVPMIVRAAACRVDLDRSALTLLFFAPAGEALVRAVATNARIAVCFNRPSSHETLQLKGHDARPVRASALDLAAVRRNLDLFAADLQPLGWDAGFVDTLLWREPADLLAIRFRPEAVYAQTPGPHAGSRLEG